MPYLHPNIVAKAARTLFGAGHSEALVFFFLKAQGASTGDWIKITSANTPPEGLLKIAGQPDGFDKLVKKDVDSFQDKKSSSTLVEGMPTRPGARGSLDGYSMYFPITEEAQYILRKNDCNRNAVYSNITGGRGDLNKDRKTSRDDIFELRDPQVANTGKDLRLKPGYVFAAYWYYGPRPDTPMRVPLLPLAIWMHRASQLPSQLSIDDLVAKTIEMLHITDEELHLIFDRDCPLPLSVGDFIDSFDIDAYFRALCVPSSTIEISKPTISKKHLELDRETWEFKAQAFGLREETTMTSPQAAASSLIASGERNLLLFGPPRTGKSHLAMEVAAEYLEVDRSSLDEDPRFARVQFHQGWSYGDFIRKIMPVPAEGIGLRFERANGAFLEHCATNCECRSVFVIDEINRAPLANVFGEAFQVIETGYRGVAVDLPGSLPDDEITALKVPKELLLIATGNDLDKSTLPLDFAFLGRFSVVDCPVRYDLTYQVISAADGWDGEKAESFVMLLREAEDVSGYPVGHASFYGFSAPKDVIAWYRARLRPALVLHLTKYRKEDLERIDALFTDWKFE